MLRLRYIRSTAALIRDNRLTVYLLLQLIFTLLFQLRHINIMFSLTEWEVWTVEFYCLHWNHFCCSNWFNFCQWTGETNYRWAEAHLALWPGRWIPPSYSSISDPRCVHWTQTASGPERAVAGASFPPDLAGITHRLLWRFISIEPKWPKAVWHCSDIKQQ